MAKSGRLELKDTIYGQHCRGWRWKFVLGGSGGRKSPSEVQGRSPGRGSGDEVPQKLKQFLKKYVLIFIKNNCKITENSI